MQAILYCILVVIAFSIPAMAVAGLVNKFLPPMSKNKQRIIVGGIFAFTLIAMIVGLAAILRHAACV
ncbi:MAG TPA: hypothetical protein VN922_06885 [Bacteroidia bacterium]|nr:hypothetical protein [Bacteroidia bacterium]